MGGGGRFMYDIFTPIKEDDAAIQFSILPSYLQESIKLYKIGEEKAKTGKYFGFDNDFCQLQSDINIAEVSGDITSEQAWSLRHNILGIVNKI